MNARLPKSRFPALAAVFALALVPGALGGQDATGLDRKADLLPASYDILKRLIEKLEKFPNYEVGIAGHTDSIGSDEYNQKLSERRALSVYKYLVEQDVDKERLSTEGFGETQPIDDNETESGRARNRRVEFYLTKKP